MKKRTSKSASETQETSSPSGTSGQTGGTGNKKKTARQGSKFGMVLQQLNSLTSLKFRQSLLAAGIIGSDGMLTKKYKKVKK